MFTEKCECSDLFTIAENKYRTEASLYKDKKIVQEALCEKLYYLDQGKDMIDRNMREQICIKK